MEYFAGLDVSQSDDREAPGERNPGLAHRACHAATRHRLQAGTSISETEVQPSSRAEQRPGRKQMTAWIL
jgi:hypothetical protein